MVRMNLKVKIIAGLLSAFVALVCLSVLTSVASVKTVKDLQALMPAHEMRGAINQLEAGVLRLQVTLRGYLLTMEPATLAEISEAELQIERRLKFLQQGLRAPAEVAALNEVVSLLRLRKSIADELLQERRRPNGAKRAIELLKRSYISQLSKRIIASIAKLDWIQQQKLAKALDASEAQMSDLARWARTTVLLTAVVLLIGSVFLIRSLNRPLAELAMLANQAGEGNLSYRIGSQVDDELGKLSRAFDSMAARLEKHAAMEVVHCARLEKISNFSVRIGTAAAAEEDPESIMRLVVDSARELVAADFGAIGIGTDQEKPFSPWAFSGLSAEVAGRIGGPPRPRGLLGLVATLQESIRIPDITQHDAYQGFPQHHPPMEALLATPLIFKGAVVGNLYLTKSPGKPEFTLDEQHAIELLAVRASITLENVRLQQELRQAVSAREDLVAVVSHDLKNPLGVVAMASELLLKRDATIDSETSRRLLERIRRSSRRMGEIINDLLDTAAIAAGRISVKISTQDISTELRALVDEFRLLAEEKKISLTLGPLPPSPLQAKCDLGRLHQLLGNLVGNAIKFTPVGGHVRLNVQEKGPELEFSVEDDGPGMQQADMEKLFKRFVRIEQTGERGHGLGLYIAKGIVEAHAGKISVDSHPGQGTTFTFTIPRGGTADIAPVPHPS